LYCITCMCRFALNDDDPVRRDSCAWARFEDNDSIRPVTLRKRLREYISSQDRRLTPVPDLDPPTTELQIAHPKRARKAFAPYRRCRIHTQIHPSPRGKRHDGPLRSASACLPTSPPFRVQGMTTSETCPSAWTTTLSALREALTGYFWLYTHSSCSRVRPCDSTLIRGQRCACL
jgi:hypothetical protein